MKSVSRLMGILCLSLLFSCRAEPVDSNSNSVDYLTMGQWKIRECVGSGMNPQNNLAAYSLVFTADGRVSATGNGNQLQGTWSLHRKVEGESLVLQVQDPASDLTAINSEWDLEYSDPNTVKLQRTDAAIRFGRP